MACYYHWPLLGKPVPFVNNHPFRQLKIEHPFWDLLLYVLSAFAVSTLNFKDLEHNEGLKKERIIFEILQAQREGRGLEYAFGGRLAETIRVKLGYLLSNRRKNNQERFFLKTFFYLLPWTFRLNFIRAGQGQCGSFGQTDGKPSVK